jgi:hypothetical protein
VLGVVCVALQLWIYSSWLAGGVTQVTQYRDTGSASWWAARCFEGLAVIMAVSVAIYVLRGCLSAGRLTFDAMMCAAGLATFWIDPIDNWVQPLFSYSSNWLNLRDWSGHVPLVINPDAGRMPEPLLFIGLCYLFGFPLFVMLLNTVMRWIQHRWPGLPVQAFVAATLLCGIVLDLAFEAPMFLLQLWAFPGTPDLGILVHSAKKFPLVEFALAGPVFATIALVRYFKDDRGRTIVERGWDRLRPRARAIGSTLALIAVFNFMFLAAGFTQMAAGLYSARYKPMPAHLINGMCGPGTRYGTCPGSPGYRIPLRGSLAGQSR